MRNITAILALVAIVPLIGAEADAQTRTVPTGSSARVQPTPAPIPPLRPLEPLRPAATAPGRVAMSSVGEVGQRQSLPADGVVTVPTGRVDARIANRIQSRLRTRIDRNYGPLANIMSPFAAADNETRKPGRAKR